MGAQNTPIQKTYEINIGQDSINIDFLGQTHNNLRQLQHRMGCKIYKISKNFKFH